MREMDESGENYRVANFATQESKFWCLDLFAEPPVDCAHSALRYSPRRTAHHLSTTLRNLRAKIVR